MTSLVKIDVPVGLHRGLPKQRSLAEDPVPVEDTVPVAEPALPLVAPDRASERLSVKDLFCLGFAFSAALLLIGGGAAASIDDNVPASSLTSISGR